MGTHRKAFLDFRRLSRGFDRGDIVQKSSMKDNLITPYHGKVFYVNHESGYLMVMWPWGMEQELPDQLVKIGHEDADQFDMDFMYDTWDARTHGAYSGVNQPGHMGLSYRQDSSRSNYSKAYKVASHSMHHGNDIYQTVSIMRNNGINGDEAKRVARDLYGLRYKLYLQKKVR